MLARMNDSSLPRHVAVGRRELLEQVQWQDLMVSEEVLARLLYVWWAENRLREPGFPLDDLVI